MQRKRIPRLNEYQSRRGTCAALMRRRSPPAHRGRGCKRRSGVRPEPPWTPGAWAHAPLWRGDVFLCISGYVHSKKGI